ncbi:MAG: hypothetical protein HC854_09180 [Flavobacterium sp.]|nr:hypothetical protein [Flavobacterium sp.]
MILTEQKLKETYQELKELLNNDLHKNNLIDNLNEINEELEEVKIQRSVVNNFKSLSSWYSNLFVFDFLDNNVTSFRADATLNGYNVIMIYNEFLPQYPNNPRGPSFEDTGYYLANCIIEKWYVQSENLLRIINNGLNSGLLKGGDNFKPSAWFIIEIANKGFHNEIDYSKYNYPKSMGVYQEALNNWNTTDMGLLDNIITKLCDYHLENATYGDGENTMHIQFDDCTRFVYTYEILTWLSIREMAGLPNLNKLSHPLMDLALNKLPKVVTPMPQNELFEKVMAKLKS